MITGTTTTPIYALGTTASAFINDVHFGIILICAFLLVVFMVNKILKMVGGNEVEFSVDDDDAFPL